MEIKIMTFNLRFNNPKDGKNAWPHRSHLAAQMIEESKAAVIGTQEGLFSMLTDLQVRLPHYEWVGISRRGDITDEFSAVLYNGKLLRAMESGTFWLSETPEQPASIGWDSSLPRICTWARFQCREQPYIQFMMYNTHLDHIGQKAREQGVRLICRKIAENKRRFGLPALLSGDLNAEPDNAAIRFLQGKESTEGDKSLLVDVFTAWPGGAEEAGSTFHGFKGGMIGLPIDYLFATRDVVIKNVNIDRRAIDGSYPSDHYPVSATIVLP